jgi:hypothetical protein
MHTPETEPRGVGGAAKEVADRAKALVGLELELAGLELKRKLGALALGIALVVVAAVLALFAIGFLLATVAAALATFLATWLALLIVGGFLLLLTAALGLAGAKLVKRGTPPVPEQAITEAKLTSEALKSNGRR